MTATLPIVNRATAMLRQTQHQFLQGIGYIVHSGPPDLPAAARGNANCDPPPGTAEGSVHLLQPPGAFTHMPMRWISVERAWASLHPGKGNRLAWTTDHLRKAGWEYVGPLEEKVAGKRRK